MIKIRIHGRGRQGAKTATELLPAVVFSEEKFSHVQGAMKFGPERGGAPVAGFVRISDKKIRERGEFFDPDMVIVLDETLIEIMNIADGLKPGSVILINSKKPEEHFANLRGFRLVLINADGIALSCGLGTAQRPIVSTAMVAAFLKVSALAGIETLVRFIDEKGFKEKEKNKKIATEAYNFIRISPSEPRP